MLEQPARARINTIKAVNPAKAEQVEMIIMRMLQSGQIRGKVDEATLVRLLDQVRLCLAIPLPLDGRMLHGCMRVHLRGVRCPGDMQPFLFFKLLLLYPTQLKCR